MKKLWITLAIILGIFLALHFLLEPLVERFVNKKLSNLEEYTGQIEDVDIHLYRGAYRIKNLNIRKIEGDTEKPFVEIDTIDLSVEWNAIFKGEIVGDVVISRPVVNFVATKEIPNDEEQSGEEVNWTEQLQELMPLTINRFEIREGNITYSDPSTDPKVEAYLENLDLLLENISNVEDSTVALPSSLKATATTLGGGNIDLNMKMNLLNEIPEFTSSLELSDLDLTALNELFEAYANFDVQNGTFAMISEITVEDQQIGGYIKPFFENLDVFSFEEDVVEEEEKGFFGKIWEALVGAGSEVLENQPRDRVATEVPIQGSLDQPDVDVSVTVWNVFRNAFVEAIQKEFEVQAQPS
ncbi:DUF748 domain-containing protein [Catalinimonas niigatensis]|uniref:DUF748 domain-containing protein n=1 Tax=Catalinimonas niigatensis TaxID=1397264 RepID=UPI00266559C3|nr:DUF748 domain-containing protein [Catalinimonas niigatensis]WPP48172.1 DUF748 domain-containing protein [Catalinimonas niigatensis]